MIDMSMHACPDCDRTFDTKHGVLVHQGYAHTQPHHDRNTLERLYEDEGLSSREIADKFDVSFPTILRWLEKFGIEREDPNDPTRPPNHCFARRRDQVGCEYEMVRTSIDGTLHSVSIHRLVAYAYGLIDGEGFFDWRTIVHHKSGHGLDNRPDNLEKMQRGEHMAHHWEARRNLGKG